jgi:hypothetical protein
VKELEEKGELEDGDPLNNFFKKIFSQVQGSAALFLTDTGLGSKILSQVSDSAARSLTGTGLSTVQLWLCDVHNCPQLGEVARSG